MATLRYLGPDTSFRDISYVVEVNGVPHHRHWRVGDVAQDETFDVPDEIVERFTRREDIELVTDDEAPDITGTEVDETPADEELVANTEPADQAPAPADGDHTE